MKAVGIVAEYNPLHDGHVYHMGKARELSECDATVIAMSGNFVQRGAPAVFDKWTRAEHALKCGADLVIEIPVLYCLGNAGQYASAGVRLLESMSPVSHISFGSEAGDSDALLKAAEFLNVHRADLDERIGILSKTGLSYPAARARACEELGCSPDVPEVLSSPNNILALEYLNSMNSAIPVPVKREGAGYHSGPAEGADNGGFRSSTGIRQMMSAGTDISGFVPECVCESAAELTECGNSSGGSIADVLEVRRARLFDILRTAILTSPADIIDDCPSGGEGLGNLLISESRKATDTEDLIMRVKSKRYTYTRISRLLMQVLLGITRSRYSCQGPGYVRVLGFSDRGRAILSEAGKSGTSLLPVLTNINKEGDKLDEVQRSSLELDLLASDIYAVLCGTDISSGSDHVRRPVYLKTE